ncbi:sensor histidine kinase [Streptomyces sp. NRRL S-1022]|uniref:sensor histidine kinase n=1 Tax=Streptomyces sp. NRRL S-1022 TaxID=1463880 RepID=UPI00068DB553|nr:histidine kinase [Streptomyces sp. NRRL S-1022]
MTLQRFADTLLSARAVKAVLSAGTRVPPFAWDFLLVALLSMATLPVVAGEPVAVTVSAGLLLPLIWRRRAPWGVFCAVAAAALAQWLVGYQLPAAVTLLVALYTVVAHSTRHYLVVACLVMEGGILLACQRWAAEGRFLSSAVVLNALAAAAALLGANTRALKERAAYLEHEWDQQARLAVAEERGRITREMHDIVTHNLSVMVALADSAPYAQSADKASAVLLQISETGRQALTDMRRALGILRADEPDAERHPLPGMAQLEDLADQMRAAGMPTRLEVRGDHTTVPVTAQLTVYRLVQEALTNTLKHTPRGTQAQVRISCQAETITVDVMDDGPYRGHPDAPSGHGIRGMRERAAAYGGALQAGPLPNGGWHVCTRLDLSSGADVAV